MLLILLRARQLKNGVWLHFSGSRLWLSQVYNTWHFITLGKPSYYLHPEKYLAKEIHEIKCKKMSIIILILEETRDNLRHTYHTSPSEEHEVLVYETSPCIHFKATWWLKNLEAFGRIWSRKKNPSQCLEACWHQQGVWTSGLGSVVKFQLRLKSSWVVLNWPHELEGRGTMAACGPTQDNLWNSCNVAHLSWAFPFKYLGLVYQRARKHCMFCDLCPHTGYRKANSS